ncbi:hypothetical protein Rhopal_002011-T1 [Rhodotorula paludigena]|uniref:separase n=1 Tax=Rhodotorula paludigena TaxID=86838 RepID=A0AAV5GI75_9BASI|nr:hypothetical protein Rhopal_002011-T1 [Rhodotorula paludigena]
MSALRPPPAPAKTRRTAAPRPAPASTRAVDTLAVTLDSLEVSQSRPLRAATTRTATATRTVKSAFKPLGRSTAQNRPLPSTSSSAATVPAKARAAPARTNETQQDEAKSPAERARDVTKALNSALAALSSFAKSGFRASTPVAVPSSARSASPAASTVRSTSSSTSLRATAAQAATRDKVEHAAREANKALKLLRALAADGVLGRKKVDVEKAAGSIVASLVEMEMFPLAVSELSFMRASILSWWSDVPPAPSASPLLSHLPTFLIPLPPASFFAPPSLSETLSPSLSRPTLADVVPLVLAIQQYLLGAFFRSPAFSAPAAREERDRLLSDLLRRSERTSGSAEEQLGTPQEWRALWDREKAALVEDANERDAVDKRLDAMLTSLFGTITKGCTGAEGSVAPEHLLTLRLHALLYYASTSALAPSIEAAAAPDKLAAFHDQHRKILLLYGRQAEKLGYSASRIGAEVRAAFEQVVKRLEEKGLMDGREGGAEKWRELCEVVLHIARRADDLAFIERVSHLLGVDSSPSDSSCPIPPDPSAHATQLCAKLANALAAFESHTRASPPSSDEAKASAVADQLRRASSALPLLTRLRTSFSAGSLEAAKIDKLVDRTRYILVKHLKRGVSRLDQLIVPLGAPAPARTELEAVTREAVERLATHAEALAAHEAGNDARTTGAVDSLVVLAYSSLVLDDRSTYSASLALLRRARALVLAPAGLRLEQHYALRTLASAGYNLGGTLYNAQRADAAGAFVELACEVGEAALLRAREVGLTSREGSEEGELLEGIEKLKIASEEDGEDDEDAREKRGAVEKEMKEAVADFERLMGRRYELLALVRHAIRDKKNAYDAYIASALAQPSATFSSLASDAASLPLSTLLTSHAATYKLVQRFTRLAVFDLLLPPSSIPLTSAPRASSLPLEARAVLVEMQVAALEPYSERDEARRAILALVEALEGMYDADEYPMRRARVLLRKLQASAMGGHAAKPEEVAMLADEIKQLCEREESGPDARLHGYAPQYLAVSHIFLAIHAHSAHPPSSSTNECFAGEARQALKIFSALLEDELPASPSAPVKRASPVVQRTAAPGPASPLAADPNTTRTTRSRPTRAAATPARTRTALKTPQASRALGASTLRRAVAAPQAAPEQTTPPRATRGKVDLRASPELARHGARPDKLILDDVEKVYSLFDSLASLLGTLGEILLKIACLKFLRRLSSKLPCGSADAFIVSSTRLAREYLRLGKTSRAGIILAQAESRTHAPSGAPVSVVARLGHSLCHAEYLALLGNHDRSAQAYETALSLADSLEEDASATSSTVKIVERTLLLQRASTASSACSLMLQRKGELSRSIAPAMQAMRLGTRALNNVSRLASAPSASPLPPDSTFSARPTDHVTPLADAAPINERKGTVLPGGAHAGLSWQLAELLLDAILRVASLHFVRGTPKSADFFAQQALDLAEDLASPRQMARALSLRADVRMHWGKMQDASGDLDRATALLGSANCAEAAELQRLQADLHHRASMQLEAFQLYLAAQSSLDTFVASASDGDAGRSPVKQHTPAQQYSSGRRPARNLPTVDWVLPASQAYLLRAQIRLLRQQKKPEEAQRLVRRLTRLALLEEDKADELRLLAMIRLQELLVRCTSDPVLGMLPDSVLSMPVLGISAAGAVVKIGTPRTGPTVLNAIKDIDTLLGRAISLSTSRAQPAKLRELAALSSTMRAMQASVGKITKRSAATVAHVLDVGLAVTLCREMLDAVEHRLALRTRHDDLTWPIPEMPPMHDEGDADLALLHSLRERYRIETPEPSLVETPLASLLPPAWSAITVHLTPSQDSLILCRYRREAEPLVFKLPLDRLARREGEEDEAFTFALAQAELREIIQLNNAGAQNAKNVESKDERAAWWQERKELDQRLAVLLQTIEDAWLGAFKSVFCDARPRDAEAFLAFKARIERILKRSMVRAAGDKRSTRFKLDDAVVECIAALPSSSREEDLEDLFSFMAESFQFSGVPLACDETDVDQVVVDLREALEELHGTKSAPKSQPNPDEHTFLILDKALQAFPWESLPCLQGRSVSRLPSLAFLRDRLDLAASRADAESTDRTIDVDASRTSYILNPGGDLKNTQKTFEPWLHEQTEQRNWSGVVGRTPMEEEVKNALQNKELFLFFGHGGAEQYIRSQTIRHLPRCAVTMLWGCSSGHLKDQGDFEPVGTPYHYMVGGCPALVANLWDVTDKDIDKFAFSVLRQTGIAAPETASAPSTLTLTAAVAQSRTVCNLRYLNGAAPVVYGIPVRFRPTAA